MKRRVISIRQDAALREAAALMEHHHIGTLPVVDARGCLVGLLLMHHLLELAMPDFVHLIEDFDFVRDFGAVEQKHPPAGSMDSLVNERMSEPVCVEQTSGLMRAVAVLNQQHLIDLPVVDESQHLVGIVSRVDIGIALLRRWNSLYEVDV